MVKEGWLARQFANAEREIAQWPPWMKRTLEEDTQMTLTLTDDQIRSLGAMALSLGVREEEVLRKALALLQTALREAKDGNDIAVIRDGKVIKNISWFFPR